tara:strand:- start:59 stop:763 length:705 start_codon:yes stop_codon:yes gene_type:complete
MRKIDIVFENQLKKKLAKLPVENLLIEMTNNSYYFPYNIWKKYFDKSSIESGKWISWFATRQAEKIYDKTKFEKLTTITENINLNSEIKRKAYFCLGHLAKNLCDKQIFEYLMTKLEYETEENKETILIAITNAEKPLDFDLSPIVNVLKNGKIGMKTSAAIALKNSKNPEIESILLESFEKEKNRHLQEMIAATLRTVGSKKSIPILENKLKISKGRDYKYFLESALEEIKRK